MLNRLSDRDKLRQIFEFQLLQRLRHPNIVKYKESIYEKHSQLLYIVMEFCEEGDLLQKIDQKIVEGTSFTKQEVLGYLKQILEALVYLEMKQVIHRDLKPGNILINGQNVAKIADFNVSRIQDLGIVYNRCKVRKQAPKQGLLVTLLLKY